MSHENFSRQRNTEDPAPSLLEMDDAPSHVRLTQRELGLVINLVVGRLLELAESGSEPWYETSGQYEAEETVRLFLHLTIGKWREPKESGVENRSQLPNGKSQAETQTPAIEPGNMVPRSSDESGGR